MKRQRALCSCWVSTLGWEYQSHEELRWGFEIKYLFIYKLKIKWKRERWFVHQEEGRERELSAIMGVGRSGVMMGREEIEWEDEKAKSFMLVFSFQPLDENTKVIKDWDKGLRLNIYLIIYKLNIK